MVGMDEDGIVAAAATAVIGAAAATAVIGGTTSAPPPPIPFVVDRPFLLGIRDRPTGARLFWGRIVVPE